jgi:DNA-binding transcriptional LysR family regulator
LYADKKVLISKIKSLPETEPAASSVTGASWRRGFSAHRLSPEIVLSAAGAEVITAYVAAGLGVAVIQELAFDKRADGGIRAIPEDHLFEPVTAVVTIRRGTFLTSYMRDLLKITARAEEDPALGCHSAIP